MDRHRVVNVGVLEWSAEDCGFDLQLGQLVFAVYPLNTQRAGQILFG
jgi:hypothetical protein